jgi:hypothetical protein
MPHDLGVDHVGQSVGAQQIDIVRFHAILEMSAGTIASDAERACHEILVERKSGLIGGDLSAVDLVPAAANDRA